MIVCSRFRDLGALSEYGVLSTPFHPLLNLHYPA